jgi:hypothetical protein
VAFAIGVQQLSIHKCLEEFKSFAKSAFTKRLFADWFFLGPIVLAICGSKYREQELEKALKIVFGTGKLFGVREPADHRTAVRAGVVACTESNHTPVVMANYNRVQTDYCKALSISFNLV